MCEGGCNSQLQHSVDFIELHDNLWLLEPGLKSISFHDPIKILSNIEVFTFYTPQTLKLGCFKKRSQILFEKTKIYL